MLTVIRDPEGRIEAACEWVPCDDHGHPSNYYSRVFVNQFEVSEGTNIKHILTRLIKCISAQAPAALGAYWERVDRTGPGIVKMHSFSREQLLRFACGVTQVLEEVRSNGV